MSLCIVPRIQKKIQRSTTSTINYPQVVGEILYNAPVFSNNDTSKIDNIAEWGSLQPGNALTIIPVEKFYASPITTADEHGLDTVTAIMKQHIPFVLSYCKTFSSVKQTIKKDYLTTF